MTASETSSFSRITQNYTLRRAQHSGYGMAPQLTGSQPDRALLEVPQGKQKLHERYADISKTRGGPEKVRRRLAEVLAEVWAKDIEPDFLESLWESMPRRVAAVLAAKGWYAKY
jgi:hypothetical protein